MAIDLSHASMPTALDAIEFSRVPVVFSHNAAYALRPNRRTRRDEELVACAENGGLICITAVPNSSATTRSRTSSASSTTMTTWSTWWV